MKDRVDLGIGAEALALLTKPVGRGDKNRREVLGIANVRVIDPHVDGRYDVFKVVIERSSENMVGRELEIQRCDLYAMSEPAEVQAFRELVEFYWSR